MEKALFLLAGVAAWCGVAALAILIVNSFNDQNQILWYFPILAAVIIAWAVGEAVTERVFAPQESED